MIPRSSRFVAAPLAGLLIAFATLSGCNGKPSTPAPKAATAGEGPTAASGGPPSGAYPAGIKPAPSGDTVQTAAKTDNGPSEGATAVGGVTAGQAGGAAGGGGGTSSPTAGDGRAAPK